MNKELRFPGVLLKKPRPGKTIANAIKRYAIWVLGITLLLSLCVVTLASRTSQLDIMISEWMAVNGSTLADQDGDRSDWIELYNAGTTDLDLDGWYLTDNRRDLTRWRFPSVKLAAHSFLIVFASEKDRSVAGSELHTNFKLRSDGEYLALVEPDGWTIAWECASQYPPQFQDVSYGLVAERKARYLTVPTPGRANGAAAANRGPILSHVQHSPTHPTTNDPIAVYVHVETPFAPATAVTLHVRIMHGATIDLPMFDDGAHDDGAAGDGAYGATIPSGMHQPGDLVRYYITATDRDHRTSRWPLFNDPLNSPKYLGTMIADPSVDSKLPVLYWFVGDPSAAETTSGTRCSVFYDGILYDNVFVRSRGLTGTYWHKKSLKFDLNQGYHFQFSPDQEPVEEFNLNSTYSDKAYIRQVLAWETYRDAGSPYCISFPMRVQQNGAFYSVAIWVEQPDERYLERQGLDPKGAMYKMLLFNSLESAVVGVAKKTRLDEDHSDLQELIDAINLPAQERTAYLYDHVNIPAVINYLAAATVILDRDFGHNNYYMYRDTEGTGEWMFLPWDKDLTFGRNYLHYQGGTFNDVIWADHDPESHPLSCYTSNYLIDALYDTRTIQEMYLRRLRTLMDELLQAPGTPASELHDEQRIDELVDQMLPDVILDAAHWPTWGTPQTFTEAVDIIKDDYLAVRRVHLYDTHGPANNGLVPEAQPANVNLDFGPIDVDPVSGDQDEEYFALVNHNSFAVDISGWKVAYDVEYTFQPGVVIPAGGTLYVSPNIVAFRNRAASPTGGEGHFVQGNYRGRLSNTWGVLKLYNTDARLVNVHVFFNRR